MNGDWLSAIMGPETLKGHQAFSINHLDLGRGDVDPTNSSTFSSGDKSLTVRRSM